ncbi:MAG TPA: hypothetical protein VFT98_08940 [Myxococcota bacterium]|nr:hypothetical protein [Myxococcota bacterium]
MNGKTYGAAIASGKLSMIPRRWGNTRPRCATAPATVARASAAGISNAEELQPTTVVTIPTPATAWISEKGSEAGT